MISKDNIHRFFTYTIIVAIFLYAIIKSGENVFFPVDTNHSTSLVKSSFIFLHEIWGLASFVLSALLTSIFINMPFVIKRLLGKDYLVGKYEGTSNSKVNEGEVIGYSAR